jgi:transcriptional regulator with XRE-family HTH domain|tara:strand:+ start:246 stop:599 length:354 start_codon:yes stop_codon:yes gene_type:complete
MRITKEYKRNLEKDNQFYIELGKKLKQARLSKVHKFSGKSFIVTQSAVAKAANTTFQQIQKYEKGINRIPLINLIKISKFLKKPLSYFLSDYDNEDSIAENFNIAFQNEIELLEEQE